MILYFVDILDCFFDMVGPDVAVFFLTFLSCFLFIFLLKLVDSLLIDIKDFIKFIKSR